MGTVGSVFIAVMAVTAAWIAWTLLGFETPKLLGCKRINDKKWSMQVEYVPGWIHRFFKGAKSRISIFEGEDGEWYEVSQDSVKRCDPLTTIWLFDQWRFAHKRKEND
jgi:hypothetical protein